MVARKQRDVAVALRHTPGNWRGRRPPSLVFDVVSEGAEAHEPLRKRTSQKANSYSGSLFGTHWSRKFTPQNVVKEEISITKLPHTRTCNAAGRRRTGSDRRSSQTNGEMTSATSHSVKLSRGQKIARGAFAGVKSDRLRRARSSEK
jgi:hypothetical protein